MSAQNSRSSRIEARISPEILALVKRAAEIQGRSVSDFVVTAAQEAAQKTIEETNIIRLSIEDQEKFVDLLLNPPNLSPVLEKAKQYHSKMVVKSK